MELSQIGANSARDKHGGGVLGEGLIYTAPHTALCDRLGLIDPSHGPV